MKRGFIDMHNHLLPGMDDGSSSLHETERMLSWYASHGFDIVVATPHYESATHGQWSTQFQLVYPEVRELANEHGIRVVAGAEMRLTPTILRDDIRTIGETRYVLVDFPSGVWPFYAEESIYRLQTYGYSPILAHPERYGSAPDSNALFRSLVDRGVLLQVTMASFTGLFGRTTRNLAIDLLEAGIVHIVATDAHGGGARLESAERALTWLGKEYGQEVLDTLLYQNPLRILQNQDVEPVRVASNRGTDITASITQMFQRLRRRRE